MHPTCQSYVWFSLSSLQRQACWRSVIIFYIYVSFSSKQLANKISFVPKKKKKKEFGYQQRDERRDT